MTITEYNYCVKEFADHLYRFARKSIGDEDEAKDAVQQAFLVLWEKREDVVYLKAKSFLFTVAYRRSMDFHRNHKQLIDPELLRNTLQIEDKKTIGLKEILHQALLQISSQGRTLVLLKDYEGYNYEEIAELTQLNITQVKVYLHRARKELKNYLVSSGNLI